MEVPQVRWMVYMGKSHLEMDDEQGYPTFLQTSKLMFKYAFFSHGVLPYFLLLQYTPYKGGPRMLTEKKCDMSRQRAHWQSARSSPLSEELNEKREKKNKKRLRTFVEENPDNNMNHPHVLCCFLPGRILC